MALHSNGLHHCRHTPKAILAAPDDKKMARTDDLTGSQVKKSNKKGRLKRPSLSTAVA
jgi:hypothetical protein